MARSRILIGYNGAPQGEDALALGRLMAEALDGSASVAIVARVSRRALEDEELEFSLATFCEPLFATARELLADVSSTSSSRSAVTAPIASSRESSDFAGFPAALLRSGIGPLSPVGLQIGLQSGQVTIRSPEQLP